MITYIVLTICFWSVGATRPPLAQMQRPNPVVQQSVTSNETYYELSYALFRRRRRSSPGLTEAQIARWKFINAEFTRIHREAELLIVNRQFDEAIEVYRTMLQYEPEYTYTYVRMGDVRSMEGNFEASLNFYKQGEAIMEDVPLTIGLTVEPLMRAGDVYAKQSNYSKAADAYRKIVYRIKENDWVGADGKSTKAKLFLNTDRFAYTFPGNRQYRSGNVSDYPDVLARCALYLSKAGQRDEAFYVYGLALKQLRIMNENYTASSPSQYTIINDTDVRWTDALDLPKNMDTRTFEAACYTAMSLTVGESSWIDESGKLWSMDRRATLAAAQKAITLAPDFAPGQFALGLAYKKNQVTEPYAAAKAQTAFEKAAKSGNISVSVAAKEVLKRTKLP